MSFDVTNLTDYVDENRLPLIASLVKEAKSVTIFEVQTGFKHSGAINIMDTDVVLQADACGRTPDGTTTLSQRILTVGAIKVEENLCPKDLNKKWAQHLLKSGSKDDAIPFEAEFAQLKARKIAQANEVAIWQGDTDSSTVNLKRFDGFLKIIDAEATVIDGNVDSVTAVAGITKENVMGIVEGMYTVMPTQVLSQDDAAVFCGWDVFRLFILALKDANLYHYAPENSNGEIMIPGTNLPLIALEGISDTSRLVAGRKSDFVIGVDMENEEENFEMWYSKDDKVVKFDAAYKLGCQIKFPEQIVEFTLSGSGGEVG